MASYEKSIMTAREKIRAEAEVNGWTRCQTGRVRADRFERNGLFVGVEFTQENRVSWAEMLKGIRFLDGTGRTQKLATVLGWLRQSEEEK